jgi:hypothetical protein
VSTKIKSQLNLIGFGCNENIIHKCVKTTFDSVPIDIEVSVTKIFGYFRKHTVRAERLIHFCEFAAQEYKRRLCQRKMTVITSSHGRNIENLLSSAVSFLC